MTSSEVVLVVIPHGMTGFHAGNNEFQYRGPRGFVELKPLPQADNTWYVRIDMPGVAMDSFNSGRSNDDKLLVMQGVAPPGFGYEHGERGREYRTALEMACRCCKFGRVEATIAGGVVRLTIQKVPIELASECDEQPNPAFVFAHPQCLSGSSSRWNPATVIYSEENPYVVQGSRLAYETKDTMDGGVFVRIDLPGVVSRVRVSTSGGEVRFGGVAENVEGDTLPRREYMGSISPYQSTMDPIRRRIIDHNIVHDFSNGVLRMIIPKPVPS